MYLNERYPKTIGHFVQKGVIQPCIHPIVSLNVDGSSMVSNRSFTLLHSPYWNWFMNVASSHDMSQIYCLKLDVYTIAGHGPWWKACSLLIDVCFL